MKIIQAMKQIKLNEEKITDLQAKIRQHSAHLNVKTPEYPLGTVEGWVQTCLDISQDNVKLLCEIQRTNLATMVTIELGGKSVTKSIAEWIWRRRKYAAFDNNTIQSQRDDHLRQHDGQWQAPATEGEAPVQIKIIRSYDPVKRDELALMFREEPTRIDAELEVVNAVTDLITE